MAVIAPEPTVFYVPGVQSCTAAASTYRIIQGRLPSPEVLVHCHGVGRGKCSPRHLSMHLLPILLMLAVPVKQIAHWTSAVY